MTNTPQASATQVRLDAILVSDAIAEGRWREALVRMRLCRTGMDELIPLCVRKMRAEGAMWWEIGSALGITTQAAHKKFAADADDVDKTDVV